MKNILSYKLFENNVRDIYQKSLKDEYWREISKKFSNYNNSNTEDYKKAIEFIYNNIKNKYKDFDIKFEKELKDSIAAGIS